MGFARYLSRSLQSDQYNSVEITVPEKRPETPLLKTKERGYLKNEVPNTTCGFGFSMSTVQHEMYFHDGHPTSSLTVMIFPVIMAFFSEDTVHMSSMYMTDLHITICSCALYLHMYMYVYM